TPAKSCGCTCPAACNRCTADRRATASGALPPTAIGVRRRPKTHHPRRTASTRGEDRMTGSKEITALLQRDDVDDEALLAVVYDELHRLAASMMRSERPGHTLQPTVLVHEAWLKLVN